MCADRWQRLKDLVDAASRLPPEARAPFLAEACADDSPLRLEVESLLRADDGAGSFLSRAVGAAQSD